MKIVNCKLKIKKQEASGVIFVVKSEFFELATASIPVLLRYFLG